MFSAGLVQLVESNCTQHKVEYGVHFTLCVFSSHDCLQSDDN